MPASLRIPRRWLLTALGALVLAAVVVVAVVSLRSDADPASAGATTSASSTVSSGTDAEGDAPDAGDESADDPEPDDADPTDGKPSDGEADPGDDETAEPEARETLDPAPFGAEATPEPGVTVTVSSVEKVTGEASVPGEVGGPALRFDVELTNGTGKVLDMRTVVVNAYYGPDRTPTTPLLKPGARPFEPELGPDKTARGVFVFGVPPEFQDEVELEFDAGVHAAVVIFTGA
jgi:hypothetical protein